MLQKLLIPGVLSAVLAFVGLALLTPSAQTTTTTYADTSIDDEEQTFIALLNQYRVDNDLVPLLIDPSLQNAAEWMSTDLGEQAYFDHTDSTGRDPWTRMCDFGYCYNTWKGENIAAGYQTGSAVFQGWHDSPGHNANMLGSHYTVMGLALVFVQGSPFGYYWTNDFGGYTVESSPPPAPTRTPTRTPSPTPAHTPEPTPTPTATPTPTPTRTPEHHATMTPTPTPPVLGVGDPTGTPTPAPEFADVNCDSHLNGTDSVLILEFVAGVQSAPPDGCPAVGSSGIQAESGGARYHGDLDCNGVVDARDALVVLRAMSGDTTVSCS